MGISVDYSAHVMRAFLVSMGTRQWCTHRAQKGGVMGANAYEALPLQSAALAMPTAELSFPGCSVSSSGVHRHAAGACSQGTRGDRRCRMVSWALMCTKTQAWLKGL